VIELSLNGDKFLEGYSQTFLERVLSGGKKRKK
jgi:hypothetical protein